MEKHGFAADQYKSLKNQYKFMGNQYNSAAGGHGLAAAVLGEGVDGKLLKESAAKTSPQIIKKRVIRQGGDREIRKLEFTLKNWKCRPEILLFAFNFPL